MKTFNAHIRFWLILLIVFLCSCGKESSCIKNTGKQASSIRDINNAITKVKIEDNINLVITQSTTPKLEIKGGENLLSHVHTRLNGNTLEISNGNKCNFLRSYKPSLTAYLSIPNLTEINYTGKGNISSTGTLSFNDFTFETRNGTGSVNLNLSSNNVTILSHTGATDFTLTGTSKNLYVFTGSNAWLYLSEFLVDDVQVNNDGTGDVQVNSQNTLLVELTSLGNVIFQGNPVLTISTHTGSGEIIKQ